jgi:hypothetical protein
VWFEAFSKVHTQIAALNLKGKSSMHEALFRKELRISKFVVLCSVYKLHTSDLYLFMPRACFVLISWFKFVSFFVCLFHFLLTLFVICLCIFRSFKSVARVIFIRNRVHARVHLHWPDLLFAFHGLSMFSALCIWYFIVIALFTCNDCVQFQGSTHCISYQAFVCI